MPSADGNLLGITPILIGAGVCFRKKWIISVTTTVLSIEY